MPDRTGARHADLPTGTVTFVFTDIEGSTRLLQRLGADFSAVVDDHLRLSRTVLGAHEGHEIRTMGDGFFAVFPDGLSAVKAGLELQRSIAANSWPGDEEIRVRIGIHTGRGTPGGDDYLGLDVHRAARIAGVAHGGQIVVSESTRSIVRLELPPEAVLRDLGEHLLKDLAHREHLYQVSAPGLRSDFPSLRSLSSVAGNLPHQLTSFVGRSEELEKIVTLLRKVHLVTLTGPGGIGKTRLALEAGSTLAHDFPDGVFFVDLAGVRLPDLVPEVITETLRLSTRIGGPGSAGDDIDVLAQHIAGRRMLLLLDNFEQVVEAGTRIGQLLALVPDVRVMVTSRVPLRIRGEQEVPLSPLHLPDPKERSSASLASVEAIALFRDRARSVAPDFELTDDNLEPILRILRRLDGLPLAVELAASRLRLFSPEALAARVERGLDVLGSGPEDLPPRQRTIEATIRWSHDMLEESNRLLFRRLAVFSGGATLESVAAVCDLDPIGSLADVEALVAHGLLQADRDGEEPRFHMLEPIRQFAAARLQEKGEETETERRHGAHFLELAERDLTRLTVHHQENRMRRLDVEHDNLRAALERATSRGDADTALHLTGAMWRYWQMRGFLNEGRRWIDQALALQGATPEARLKGLEALGGVAYWRGELADARQAYEEALELARADGSLPLVANALHNLGFAYAAGESPDRERSRLLFEESLELGEKSGDRLAAGKAREGLGSLSYWSGDHEGALGYLEDALDVFRQLDAHFLVGACLGITGGVRQALGQHEKAVSTFQECIRIYAEEGNYASTTLALKMLAVSEAALGHTDRALRLLGAMTTLRDASGTDFVERIVPDFSLLSWNPDEATPSESIDDDESQKVMAEGRAMRFEEAIAYALAPDPRRG